MMIARNLLKRWSKLSSNLVMTAETPAVEAAARTHVGKVRQINEDRMLVRSERGLWAVADGMGGHAGGSHAAEVAIQELAGLADGASDISADAICAALDRANARILARMQGQQAASGTTIVVAWLRGTRLTVTWAGDSRAYLLRAGAVRCLTRDHSVVQDMIDAGELDPDKANRHPYAHLVTRALGAGETVLFDEIEVWCQPGDRLLLCSDGVSRTLEPIGCAVGGKGIDKSADELLAAALHRDGSDNTTLVLIGLNNASRAEESGDAASTLD